MDTNHGRVPLVRNGALQLIYEKFISTSFYLVLEREDE